MWLRENSMGDERYKGFDAPRSAALYHLIAKEQFEPISSGRTG